MCITPLIHYSAYSQGLLLKIPSSIILYNQWVISYIGCFAYVAERPASLSLLPGSISICLYKHMALTKCVTCDVNCHMHVTKIVTIASFYSKNRRFRAGMGVACCRTGFGLRSLTSQSVVCSRMRMLRSLSELSCMVLLQFLSLPCLQILLIHMGWTGQ